MCNTGSSFKQVSVPFPASLSPPPCPPLTQPLFHSPARTWSKRNHPVCTLSYLGWLFVFPQRNVLKTHLWCWVHQSSCFHSGWVWVVVWVFQLVGLLPCGGHARYLCCLCCSGAIIRGHCVHVCRVGACWVDGRMFNFKAVILSCCWFWQWWGTV